MKSTKAAVTAHMKKVMGDRDLESCMHVKVLRFIDRMSKEEMELQTFSAHTITLVQKAAPSQSEAALFRDVGVASVLPLWVDGTHVEAASDLGQLGSTALFSVVAKWNSDGDSSALPSAALTNCDSSGWSCIMDNHYDCIHVQSSLQFITKEPAQMQRVSRRSRRHQGQRGARTCVRTISPTVITRNHIEAAARQPLHMALKYSRHLQEEDITLKVTIPECRCHEDSDRGWNYCFCSTCVEHIDSLRDGCACRVMCKNRHNWDPTSAAVRAHCDIYGTYGGTHVGNPIPVQNMRCDHYPECTDILWADGLNEGVFLCSPKVGFELNYMQSIMDHRHVGACALKSLYRILDLAIGRQTDVRRVTWRQWYKAVTAFTLQSHATYKWECPICGPPSGESFKYVVADGTHSASTQEERWEDPEGWVHHGGIGPERLTCGD